MRKFLILIIISSFLLIAGQTWGATYRGEYDYFHAFTKEGDFALFSRIDVNEGFRRLLIYSGGQKIAQEEISAMDVGLVGERESAGFNEAVLALPQIKPHGFEDRGTAGLVSPSGQNKVSFGLEANEAQYIAEETGQWIPSFTGVLKIFLNGKKINEISLGNWDDPTLSEEQINKIKVHWSRDEAALAFSGFLVTSSNSGTKDYYPVSFMFPLRASSLTYAIEQKAKEKLNEDIKVEILKIDESGGRYLVKVYLKNMKKLGGEQPEVFYDVIKEYVYLTGDGKLIDKE